MTTDPNAPQILLPQPVPAQTLWKASLAAIVVGLATLALVILPAEYNIDPTGVGKWLNLTALSPEAQAELQAAEEEHANYDDSRKVVQLALMPDSGVEYKMTMQKGKQVDYEWISSAGAVYVDMHGEPAGDTSGYFKSYTVTRTNQMQGSFVAPFDGSHGWYFKNEGSEPMSVQLVFSGKYEHPRVL